MEWIREDKSMDQEKTEKGKSRNGGFLDRIKEGLSKTRKSFVKNLDEMVFGEKIINEEVFANLEEALIMADLGPYFTDDLIEEMKYRAGRRELTDPGALKKVLKEHILEILERSEAPLVLSEERPYTIMVVGVNGTGKTTTIGKMARYFRNDGKSVLLAAADTFRAAAIEQLEIWSRRAGVPLIKQKMGSDPSAVVYDALHAARARKTDVLIIDTAGRLHTKTTLMDELKKVTRIMGREMEGAPHETLLVLDATTGQNALAQARMFDEGVGITGIVLTKLDGTSKGGIVIRIAKEMKLPIRYIGVGEGLDDLREFRSEDFVEALFAP